MKVSVIIPTWNRGYIIEKTIQSVLNQTMSDLEILVCDDGSTDDTYEKVSAIKDPRIRWIPGGRGGRPAIPRNNGIREAKGEWLAFLDSDDEWLPEKLEKQLKLIEKENVKAASSDALRLIPGQGIIGNYLSFKKNRISFDDMLKVNEIITSSTIVHRSLFDEAGGFPEDEALKTIEDYAFWLRVATQTDFAYLIEPLIIYRDDAANSVRGIVESNVWKQRKEVFNDFIVWGKKRKNIEEFLKKANNNHLDAVNALKKPLLGISIEKIKTSLVQNFPGAHKIYAEVIRKIK
ncbi:MAG: Glycosyl transferase family 2 [Candidatus Moranbacteria bacterium GW2011_GWD2_36_12]|nr:MAG: Glycosyl transferase family 2 [Candidatus Moranbacteria bacterium GW2011_GWD2_36_12]KKQ05810.1 MAG: Glycosyl transferase family 2 [Candidatus Moranbacteria bacterium GW2011_GWE2_36_40]